ncbi:MAG: ankyrin repeat domain-containing protein [Bacteroidota bacterium]
MKYLSLVLIAMVCYLPLVSAQQTEIPTETKEAYTSSETSVLKTDSENPSASNKTKKSRKDGFDYQFEAINSGNAVRIAGMQDDSIHYYRKNDEGETALTLAIRNQDVAVVEVLTKRAVINLKNDAGETPLTLAIKTGNEAIIDLVAKRAKAALKNDLGETPLFLAIELDDLFLLEKLISKGARVNYKCNGVTPLARAAELNKPKTVAFLIKNNAKISAPNDNGDTPLFIAMEKGHDIVAGILLSKSAAPQGDANWSSQIGTPILHLAAAKGNPALVRVLINYGAEVDATDYMDNTALCVAAELGHIEVIRALIQGNANVSHQNMKGDTPLILAAANNKDTAVTLLLESGADATMMNYSGYVAADFYSDSVLDGLFAAKGAKRTDEEQTTDNTNRQLKEIPTGTENNQ